MVGRMFHDKLGKQECLFSFGFSYGLIDQREEAERKTDAHIEQGERERQKQGDRQK